MKSVPMASLLRPSTATCVAKTSQVLPLLLLCHGTPTLPPLLITSALHFLLLLLSLLLFIIDLRTLLTARPSILRRWLTALLAASSVRLCVSDRSGCILPQRSRRQR